MSDVDIDGTQEETRYSPLDQKLPSRTHRYSSPTSSIFANLSFSIPCRPLGPLARFPSAMPAAPHTNKPVQMDSTSTPSTPACALSHASAPSSSNASIGSGPGTSTTSSFPGATSASPYECVARIVMPDVSGMSDPCVGVVMYATDTCGASAATWAGSCGIADRYSCDMTPRTSTHAVSSVCAPCGMKTPMRIVLDMVVVLVVVMCLVMYFATILGNELSQDDPSTSPDARPGPNLYRNRANGARTPSGETM